MSLPTLVAAAAETDWGAVLVFVSFLVVIGVAVVLSYRAKIKRGRAPGPEPVCGRCGYSVRELTTMTCPECGADLREVGIIPPAKLPGATAGPPAQPVRGATKTATILLTDIKDYTSRADDSSRDDALTLLRRQRDIVQPIVQRHAGRIIKSTGDGLIASFDSATDAVLAAADIQTAVQANNRHAFRDGDKLLLRIAVSTGEVAFLDNDVLGQPVNLASRVQQLAEPGEVYFTDSTFHAMNRKEIACDDLGLIGVKGFSEKINLYRYRRPAPAGAAM